MKKLMDDVAAFHRATDCPTASQPTLPPLQRQKLRTRLIHEEYGELMYAIGVNDMAGIADAAADLIYVVVGTALEYGIALDRVWDEVQASNMTKIDPATGKVVKRADGKVLKPATFRPPDIAAALWPPKRNVNPSGRAPFGWHLCK